MNNRAAAGLTLTIDLGALASNWKRLAALAAPAECAAVVKADAYGIGIEQAVPALWGAGCRTFFVALPDEGRRAIAAAPGAAVYVLNGFHADWADAFRGSVLLPVLQSLPAIEAWSREFPQQAAAIQVDTGMNRLGFSPEEIFHHSLNDAKLFGLIPLRLLVSHLACADEPGHPLNGRQLALFRELQSRFPNVPASLANSAGIHLGREFHFDVVRPGIALYGAAFSPHHPPLTPVVTARARILQIRKAAAGGSVGYGAGFRLKEERRIAILSAGYADGYHRAAGSSDSRSGASAHLHGRPVPILGRVSMDLIAVDVTGVGGIVEGDEVELFGPNIPIDEAAAAAATVGYEFLTGLGRRATRIYVNTPADS